jgi:cytochrome c oxidase subunit 4
MEHAPSSHAHPSVGLYLAVFGALMILTAITVAVAYINLGPLNNVVALAIAGVKTVLVVLFFMHVHYASRLTKVFAMAGFFWLAILISFTLSDMQVRKQPPLSHGWVPLPATLPIERPRGVTPQQEEGGHQQGNPQAAAHH